MATPSRRSTTPAACYLQFDDTVWVLSLLAGRICRRARERGDNPEGLQQIYARVINYALAEKPADMVVTTTTSAAGKFPLDLDLLGGATSRWAADHARLAPITNGYFLEYDSDRAGGFEPAALSFAQGSTMVVVVGVITLEVWRAREEGRPSSVVSNVSRQVRAAGARSHSPRNAASPRRKRATSSPKRSSEPSSAWQWISRRKFGASKSIHTHRCHSPRRRGIQYRAAASPYLSSSLEYGSPGQAGR